MLNAVQSTCMSHMTSFFKVSQWTVRIPYPEIEKKIRPYFCIGEYSQGTNRENKKDKLMVKLSP